MTDYRATLAAFLAQDDPHTDPPDVVRAISAPTADETDLDEQEAEQ